MLQAQEQPLNERIHSTIFPSFSATKMLFRVKTKRKHRQILFLQFCVPEELHHARGNFYRVGDTVTTVSYRETPFRDFDSVM